MSAKEINIKFSGQILDYVDTKEHLLELFNHITNLQEELKSANESITWWQNRFNAIERDNKNYKSRIDKATNELNRIIEIIQEQPSKDKLDDLWILDRLDGLLRIVGGDKE